MAFGEGKDILKSKTAYGAVASLISATLLLANALGYPVPIVDDAVVHEGILQAVAIIGSVLALVGRGKAKSEITSIAGVRIKKK